MTCRRLGCAWVLILAACLVDAHKDDPRVKAYKEACEGLRTQSWETKRFRRMSKRMIKKDIFGKPEKKKTLRRRAREMRKTIRKQMSTELELDKESIESFLKRYKDLRYVRQAGKRPKLVVQSTGKEFDFLEGTEDEKSVLRRVWAYVNSKRYAKAVAAMAARRDSVKDDQQTPATAGVEMEV
mmetsp:Transcript_30895/g.54204  ORF Transcript_30895/g.54204 Transcript_30895/m.54204 type:complete len:183 (+) Transcript_30895:52-600(+)